MENKINYEVEDIPPKMASDALLAQSACNASALIHVLNGVITELWGISHQRCLGTDWVNQHPLVSMYLNQLTHLNTGTTIPVSNRNWSLVELAAEKHKKGGK